MPRCHAGCGSSRACDGAKRLFVGVGRRGAGDRCAERNRKRCRTLGQVERLDRSGTRFAGLQGGGENWTPLACLVETSDIGTSDLDGVDPGVYSADALGNKIVDSRLEAAADILLPGAAMRSASPSKP